MLADLLRSTRPVAVSLERRQRRTALDGKVAIVTGGDSPLARAVAVCMAHDGANVVLVYGQEHAGAREAIRRIHVHGSRAIALNGELDDPGLPQQVVEATLMQLGHTDLSAETSAAQGDGRPAASMTAIAAFGSTLATHLAAHRVRFKALSHGPIWSPLVPTDPDTELPVNQHQGNTGPCFVFLARNA